VNSNTKQEGMVMEEIRAKEVSDWLKSGLTAQDCYDRLMKEGLSNVEAWYYLDEGIHIILMNVYE